jgi:hypothetical protein
MRGQPKPSHLQGGARGELPDEPLRTSYEIRALYRCVMTNAEQIARQEQINELYMAAWSRRRRPAEGLPLMHNDHLRYMRAWLNLGESPASMPIIVCIAEHVAEMLAVDGYPEDEARIKGERFAAVYADLLAEEATHDRRELTWHGQHEAR